MTRRTPGISYTIKEQVYDILKQAILDGTYLPRQRLQEPFLAATLGVSRSPIREALQQLVGDGLLINVPNKGVYVKEFTKRDMEEIFDLRFILECLSLSRSAKNLSPELREDFVSIRVKIAHVGTAHNMKHYIELDNELHQLIVRLAGNELLSSIYNNYLQLITPYRTFALLDKHRYDDSITEHLAIIDSILSGNIDNAIAINSDHLINTTNIAMRYIESISTETAGVSSDNISTENRSSPSGA
ncbi:MAG: GntR family transcriptional regulator [Oscillospiraceae bacterium]